MSTKKTKLSIIQAGQKAVEELIKVAKEPIVDSGDDITADRLKNAAATKRLAMSTMQDALVSSLPLDFFQRVLIERPLQRRMRNGTRQRHDKGADARAQTETKNRSRSKG